jgi:hypothetical protein
MKLQYQEIQSASLVCNKKTGPFFRLLPLWTAKLKNDPVRLIPFAPRSRLIAGWQRAVRTDPHSYARKSWICKRMIGN